MRVKVGYPDEWRTYEGVTIEESLAETLLSANLAEAKRQFDRIDKPVDREEWHAAAGGQRLLQSDQQRDCLSRRDLAITLLRLRGGPGVQLRWHRRHHRPRDHAWIRPEVAPSSTPRATFNWWSEEDLAEFEALAAEVAAQYDAVEALPGLNVDGDLTIGENIADMGGLQIAYDALQATLAAEGDPGLIEGLTQEERFFIAYAGQRRHVSKRSGPRCSPTSTPRPRCAVQPARNMDSFFETFGIEPADPMYLPRRSASSSGNAPGCSMLRDEYFDTAKVSFRGTASCTRNLVVVRLMARMSGCCSRTQRDVFTMSE